MNLKSIVALAGIALAAIQKSPDQMPKTVGNELNFIDPVDFDYFASLNNTKSKNNLDKRSIAQINNYSSLMGNVLNGFIDKFNLRLLFDMHKLLLSSPPKIHKRKPGLPAASIQEVKDNLGKAMISFCPILDGVGIKCICTKSFSEVHNVITDNKDAVTTLAVHAKEKLIVVSYRPTITLGNIITDFDYGWLKSPLSSKGAQVHKGFLEYYRSTKDKAEAIMVKLLKKYPGYTLHVTGFSLGAAAATLSLPHWSKLLKSQKDDRKIRAFLYSGPRVGNEAFAQEILDLNIQITRYTNRNDVVSHVPPRTYGFVHVGAEVHETYPGLLGLSSSEFKVCSREYDEDPECGWKDRFPVSVLRHLNPMNKFGPLPPYC